MLHINCQGNYLIIFSNFVELYNETEAEVEPSWKPKLEEVS